MKVAIVHDDLVQFGGAERVLQAICEIFPNAPIYTSLYDDSNTYLAKAFAGKKIITSFLQAVPGWRSFYKPLFFLYPIAFEQFDFSEYDLVISHTTRFAKSIITKPNTKHICYCHTPPRFLWNFSSEKNVSLIKPFLSYLRIYDQISAKRVDLFLAGSENAKSRIKKVYGAESRVVHPFADLKRFQDRETFDGGFLVTICRLNYYKRVDLLVKVCIEKNIPLKVIGTGPELARLENIVYEKGGSSQIEFLGNVDDDTVVEVLSGAKALVIPGVEDFGITSLEAQALGKPVIALKAGGNLETVIDKKTGILFDKQSKENLSAAILKLRSLKINSEDCKQNAYCFGKESFIENFKKAIH